MEKLNKFWFNDLGTCVQIILNHIEPLTEQQLLGICSLQQSTHEAEEALSQGLEALHQSLSDTITSDSLSYPSNMANYMGQMAIAMNKLSTLEGFVRQVRRTLNFLKDFLCACRFLKALKAHLEISIDFASVESAVLFP